MNDVDVSERDRSTRGRMELQSDVMKVVRKFETLALSGFFPTQKEYGRLSADRFRASSLEDFSRENYFIRPAVETDVDVEAR